jgi:hypothetical protein
MLNLQVYESTHANGPNPSQRSIMVAATATSMRAAACRSKVKRYAGVGIAAGLLMHFAVACFMLAQSVHNISSSSPSRSSNNSNNNIKNRNSKSITDSSWMQLLTASTDALPADALQPAIALRMAIAACLTCGAPLMFFGILMVKPQTTRPANL